MKRRFTEWETRGQEVQQETLSLTSDVVIREVPPKLLLGRTAHLWHRSEGQVSGRRWRRLLAYAGPDWHDHSRSSRHVLSLQCGWDPRSLTLVYINEPTAKLVLLYVLILLSLRACRPAEDLTILWKTVWHNPAILLLRKSSDSIHQESCRKLSTARHCEQLKCPSTEWTHDLGYRQRGLLHGTAVQKHEWNWGKKSKWRKSPWRLHIAWIPVSKTEKQGNFVFRYTCMWQNLMIFKNW